ncbi:LOW QUALITY PROTEIN: sperm flagellar protein 1-like [Haliotis rubra]|uniref:LOW QUALITY PROTEIN: sperm flagellar protein 1-like n=1 Tax=Haliotis rubra TaxID=36100 RepID=UPI001EE56C44|nr:LOW QUALITY PROTEIN: sperm flagellar protein 1-like [Haliotis rubra]
MPQSESEMEELDEAQLEELYTWIDEIQLSRPKRNMNRDFSDGVLVAEVVKHYLPHFVDLHNYPPANSTQQKLSNWFMLNRKVFDKMNFQLSDDVIRSVSGCKPGVIEKVMLMVRTKIDLARHQMQKNKQMAGMMGVGPGRSSPDSAVTSPRWTRTWPCCHKLSASPRPRQVRVWQPMLGRTRGRRAKVSWTMMLSLESYWRKEQECLAKDETIQILQAKVRRLEHLIHLKDIRIDDLQNKIEATRPTGRR